MQIPSYNPDEISMSSDAEEICTCGKAMTYVGYKAPTCGEPGHDFYYKCECGQRRFYNEIPATGEHKMSEATCLTPKTCSVCGTTEGGTVAHSYVDGKCKWCSAAEQKAQPQDPIIAEGNPGNASEGADEAAETGAAETEAAASAETTGAAANLDISEATEVAEVETVETIGETREEEDFHLCNPFTCGCWIYILLALIVGLVVGLILGSHQKKKKRSKRRPRPYTEVDYNAAPMPVAEPTMVPVAAQNAACGVTAAVHQHIGARKDQQDSYGVSDLNAYASNGVLAVVADGMGGLANGAAVSSTLVHSLLNYFRQTNGRENVADMMLDMLTQSNDQINRMLQGAERSGSTLVSAVIRDGHLYFLTVGDSRIYLYRKGLLLQLNREHIYQEELALKAVNHIIPLAQVTGDRQAHALTSYLGIGRLTHIDRNYEGIKLEPGDRLLLASDGVFGTLSQADMEAALRSGIGEATDILGEKIRQAAMPYQDNNTALVLEYHG